MPSCLTAEPTFDASCSNANSGECTPTIVRPFERYSASHRLTYGSVRRQLTQEYVQKSTSTTRPPPPRPPTRPRRRRNGCQVVEDTPPPRGGGPPAATP